MPNLIAIANFIGTNQHITSPPLGGTHIVKKKKYPWGRCWDSANDK